MPQNGERGTVSLPAVNDGVAAVELHGLLTGLLATSSKIDVEGSSVERIGTPCLQVLLSTERSLRARGGRLVITRRSPVLVKALTDLGLEADFAGDEADESVGAVNG